MKEVSAQIRFKMELLVDEITKHEHDAMTARMQAQAQGAFCKQKIAEALADEKKATYRFLQQIEQLISGVTDTPPQP